MNTQALAQWAGGFDHQFWKSRINDSDSYFLYSPDHYFFGMFHSPPPNYSTVEIVASPKNSGKAGEKRPKPPKNLIFSAVFFGSKKSRVSFRAGPRTGSDRAGAGRVQRRLGCLMA